MELSGLDAPAVLVDDEHHVAPGHHAVGARVQLPRAGPHRGALSSILTIEDDLHPPELLDGGVVEDIRGVRHNTSFPHACGAQEGRHAEHDDVRLHALELTGGDGGLGGPVAGRDPKGDDQDEIPYAFFL